MGRRLKLKALLGRIFEDKASILKAVFSTKRRTASIRIAVIRATTSTSTAPPPEHRVDKILSFGLGNRAIAAACIHAIFNRIHKSLTVYVVFKGLIVLHNIITRGSFILKEQLSLYQFSSLGQNFLNFSMFYDKTNVKTREFSMWVRWYASYLELNLMIFRVLGSFVSSSSSNLLKDSENLTKLLNSDLIKEIEVLVALVEEICRAPVGLINQENDFVYEVMRLVSEDYRWVQQKLHNRFTELDGRVDRLNSGELDELISSLRKVEECRERLVVLFVNRKRNDAFWQLISQTKVKLELVKKGREGVLMRITESTRLDKRVGRPSQLLVRLLPYKGRWLNTDSATLTVSTAKATA